MSAALATYYTKKEHSMSILSPDMEGILSAMRISYEKHLMLARMGKIGVSSDPPHYTALFGALGTRNQVCGLSINEIELWFELSPFLYMKERESISLLALYAAYREIPEDFGEEMKSQLADEINRAVLKVIIKEPARIESIVHFKYPFAWIEFLSEKTLDTIRNK